MLNQLLVSLLFACLITLNSSSETKEEEALSDETHMAMRVLPRAWPDGYTPFRDVDAAYKIFEQPASWIEARNLCIEDNARLAITDSVEKIRHINSMKRSTGKWLSVGIHKLKSTRQWVRVDNNVPVRSVPWMYGNPDGSGGCAGISLFSAGLVNYSCDWAGEYFVCEKPIR